MTRRVRPLSTGERLVFAGVAVSVVMLVGAARLAPATPSGDSPQHSPVEADPSSASAPPPPPPSSVLATLMPAFPSGPEAYLIGLQPPVLLDNDCGRFRPKREAGLATIVCRVPHSNSVILFSLYDDPSVMTSEYNARISDHIPAPTSTRCSDLVESDSAWTYVDNDVEGPPQGRLACYPLKLGPSDGVQFVWTFEALNVMGQWRASSYTTGLEYFGAWSAYVRP